ncbi:hypothetical protein YC2023_010453 [Brassica napus]
MQLKKTKKKIGSLINEVGIFLNGAFQEKPIIDEFRESNQLTTFSKIPMIRKHRRTHSF